MPARFRTKRVYRRKAKTPAQSLTKMQKMEVKKLVAQPIETKYRAYPGQYFSSPGNYADLSSTAVFNSIVSGGTGTTAWNLIPSVDQAVTTGSAGQYITTNSVRSGNKISNVTFRNDFQFYLAPTFTESCDVTVKLIICRAKQIKSNYNLIDLPVGGLLDLGNSTSQDWSGVSPEERKRLDMLPINREQFTVLKVHKFRLVKNSGDMTGAATDTPNLTAHQSKDITYTHKHPSSLVYGDYNIVGSLSLPNNYNYFAFCVYWDTNCNPTGDLPPVLVNVRNHIWFKDA